MGFGYTGYTVLAETRASTGFEAVYPPARGYTVHKLLPDAYLWRIIHPTDSPRQGRRV